MYLTEVVRRLEQFYGKPLCKKDIPTVEGDYLEKNSSPLLDDAGHQHHQMMIGILNWLVCLGRLDTSFATFSLSKFTACLCEGALG